MVEVAEMPLLFCRLAADDQNPPLADSDSIHSILFIYFIQMPRNIVPAMSALRRLASLAHCTHLLFRVLKKVDEAVKPRGSTKWKLKH